MESKFVEQGKFSRTPRQRSLRAPAYVPILAYIATGTALYVGISGFFAAVAGLVVQQGLSALKLEILLSKPMLNELRATTLAIVSDPTIVIEVIVMLALGLVHYWVSGRFVRRWIVWLAMTGFGWLLLALFVLVVIAFNLQNPNIRDLSVVVYLVLAAFYGVIGAFIAGACVSVTLLIERRYRRKLRAGLLKDVF